MFKSVTTAEAAQAIIANNPRASDAAISNAARSMSVARYTFGQLNGGMGPHATTPDPEGKRPTSFGTLDLEGEMSNFQRRMKLLDPVPAYLVACEAVEHFESRLTEAQRMLAEAHEANRHRLIMQRLDEIRLAQQREWREKHGKMLDDVCRDLVSEIEKVRHDISTALMSIDLQTIRDKLSEDLRASAIAVDNIEIN